MKKLFLFCGFFIFPFLVLAQEKEPVILDSVLVEGNRATVKTPVTHSTISKQIIRSAAPNASLPLLLGLQPSVVTVTESGSGLGYTRLSVRGSDASRTNVTLNGVAINDAESQEVFWVNIPSLTSFLESVQLQRGVGTSANGSGAFGASINMETSFTSPKPHSSAEISYGSYNTTIASVGAGSGLLPSGLSFDMRYSYNTTDGYIRNGKGKLHSVFANLGYLNGSNSFKVIYIMGDQHTGITWEGISREMVEKDRRSNPAGAYYDAAGNIHYYDNETDNYTQHYIQGFYSHSFSHGLLWVNTLNYTKGSGYYENYKADTKFSKYGLEPQIIDGQTYKRSDFIIRQAMDNEYYVASSTLKYNSTKIRASAGINYSYYDGLHFGDVIWSMYNENIEDNHTWYKNRGDKWEGSIFARGEIDIDKFTLFADLQYRHIDLKMSGPDKDFAPLDYHKPYNFFNPKGGVSFSLNENNMFYASLAVAHKEPSRSDIKESIKSLLQGSVKEERLLDWEIGYKLSMKNFALGVNIYFMEYKNQLVATGKLSDVGYQIKENIPDSYRRGVELCAGWEIAKWIRLDGNVTLSLNKIKKYTAYVDVMDSDWNIIGQDTEYYEKTDLNMSPSVVGMAMATFIPVKNFNIFANGKYVGKQYYDNTSSQERSIPAYFVMNGGASYDFPLYGKKDNSPYLTLSLFVNNVLNNKYLSSAWVYRANFNDGSKPYIEEGFFPQAETNFIIKLAVNF